MKYNEISNVHNEELVSQFLTLTVRYLLDLPDLLTHLTGFHVILPI